MSPRPKFLVVDDHVENRILMTHMLKAYGDTDVAANGEEAVICYQSSLNANQPYAAIFLDIMMPEMDGHQTLTRIRELEDAAKTPYGEEIKIVMTTALGDIDNVVGSFKKGAYEYLRKPIQLQAIEKLMAAWGIAKGAK